VEHFERDLADIVAHNCTYVVHCYTETDLLWYRGAMERIFRSTRDAGLEVWADPWGVAGIFSGETLSRFVVDHPETWQVLSDGRRAAVACPSHPETRRFVGEWITAVADAGGQVAFWDEPHLYATLWRRDYSGAWSCLCEHCAAAYRAGRGGAMPAEFNDDVAAFREDVLLDFLSEMCRLAKSLGLRNCLCLLPSAFARNGFPEVAERMKARVSRHVREDKLDAVIAPALHFGVDDWERAASIPDLDIFGTDPYWFLFDVEPESFMRAFSRRAVEVAGRHGRQSQLWLQAFSLPEGREEELRMGIDVAAELGADSLAAWSHRGTADMSIACARPELVWRIIGEGFASLRT
jgi:hypothetical protein